MTMEILTGDCREILPTLAADSIDACVTDPPYELGFMGRAWDRSGIANDAAMWAAVLRTLKPGAHLLAFGGMRTHHRMMCAVEDAGFEIRDVIMWVFGSGFPKSLNLDGQWSGWGTALKPAYEPIIVARKPLSGTVAANVQRYGTGAINVDGCRVHTTENQSRPRGTFPHSDDDWGNGRPNEVSISHDAGRWPANLIHDGSEEVVRLFPHAASGAPGVRRKAHDTNAMAGRLGLTGEQETGYGDTGSAARFFYTAKASREDREEGCEGLPESMARRYGEQGQGPTPQQTPRTATPARNHHPTVKPTDLMRYLCRLVTPPGGLILDPFAGSGSTAKAALAEGFRCVSIELDLEYAEIIRRRARGQAGLPL